MKNRISRIFALSKKEIYSFLNAPLFYGVTVFFLLFCSVLFIYIQGYLKNTNPANLQAYIFGIPLVFIIVIPTLTMKSWAEERKTGSIELLLTMPFSEWDLVWGKFLSIFTLFIMMLVLTIPVPITLSALGSFDVGVIFCEYLGVILLGGAAIALGLMFSSFCKSQAGSFLGSVVVLMFFMLISILAIRLGLPDWLTSILNFISLEFHFNSFSRGVIDSRDIIFYLASTFLFLFITTRVILFRKWR